MNSVEEYNEIIDGFQSLFLVLLSTNRKESEAFYVHPYEKCCPSLMTEELGVEALTPLKVVELLDRYIVGQQEAKRAVAVALRMLV